MLCFYIAQNFAHNAFDIKLLETFLESFWYFPKALISGGMVDMPLD